MGKDPVLQKDPLFPGSPKEHQVGSIRKGQFKYVSVERIAKSKEQKFLDLLDNFRGRVAYFHGFYR